MIDRILAILPRELEQFLWCSQVLRQYLYEEKAFLNREYSATLVVRREFRFLAKPIFPDAKLVEEATQEDKDLADLILFLDRDRVYDIAKAPGKSVMEAYGVLLGTAPDYRLPIVGPALIKERPRILFLQRHETDQPSCGCWPFEENRSLFEEAFPGAELMELPADSSVGIAYQAISSSSICIGVVGGMTLLSVALMRPTLEIYPESLFPRTWNNKWGAIFYRMIVGELDRLAPEFLVNVLDSFMGEIAMKRGKKWEFPQTSTLPVPVEESTVTEQSP